MRSLWSGRREDIYINIFFEDDGHEEFLPVTSQVEHLCSSSFEPFQKCPFCVRCHVTDFRDFEAHGKKIHIEHIEAQFEGNRLTFGPNGLLTPVAGWFFGPLCLCMYRLLD